MLEKTILRENLIFRPNLRKKKRLEPRRRHYRRPLQEKAPVAHTKGLLSLS